MSAEASGRVDGTRGPGTTFRRGVGALVCALCLPAALAAQVLVPPDSSMLIAEQGARSCVDAIPAASMERVTVYQGVVPSDTSAAGILPQAELISQSIADGVRSALGGGPDALSPGDTLAGWRHAAGTLPLTLVVYRDRPSALELDDNPDTAKGRLTALYTRVLHAMPPDQLIMVWPDKFAADSVRLRITLTTVQRGQKLAAIPGRALFPAFSILQPHATPVLRKSGPIPQYPSDAERNHVIATVLMQAVIDTAGRVVPSTLHDLQPRAPLDTGRMGSYYKEFVSAVRASMLNTQFTPARLGDCPVREVVQLPFTFSIARP